MRIHFYQGLSQQPIEGLYSYIVPSCSFLLVIEAPIDRNLLMAQIIPGAVKSPTATWSLDLKRYNWLTGQHRTLDLRVLAYNNTTWRQRHRWWIPVSRLPWM